MADILIVDDDATTRSCVARMLHHGGYQTRLARKGEDALRMYLEEPAAVVILDIIMPGLDGFETLRRLKYFDAGAKVIGMTAGSRFSGDGLLAIARRLGMQATLQKPFHPEELLRVVRLLIGEQAPVEAGPKLLP